MDRRQFIATAAAATAIGYTGQAVAAPQPAVSWNEMHMYDRGDGWAGYTLVRQNMTAAFLEYRGASGIQPFKDSVDFIKKHWHFDAKRQIYWIEAKGWGLPIHNDDGTVTKYPYGPPAIPSSLT